MQRRPRSTVPSFLVTGLVLATALSGCLLDEAPQEGPVTLMEAYQAVLPAVARMEGNPHLVGFLGHEGRPPSYLAGLEGNPYLSRLIGGNLAPVDTSGEGRHGDGRTLVWVLLFATDDGRLIRSGVTADPITVETTWVTEGRDAQLSALWALNLGGRLLVDSDRAIEAARAADAAFDARIARGDRVTYTSDLVPIGSSGERDLVHALFVDDGGDDILVAHVRHYTGELIGIGPYASQRENQRVVVVDQSFTLSPAAREGSVDRDLPVPLSDARVTLETVGTGRYTFALREGAHVLWTTEGARAADNETARGTLGALEPGTYTVEASALGNVWFHLRVDGVVGI